MNFDNHHICWKEGFTFDTYAYGQTGDVVETKLIYSLNRLRRWSQNENAFKNEENLKNEDNQKKKEDNLKNKDDLKSEDNLEN